MKEPVEFKTNLRYSFNLMEKVNYAYLASKISRYR